MNARLAKKIRQAANRRDEEILPDLKRFLNSQPFLVRVRISWRILKGTF